MPKRLILILILVVFSLLLAGCATTPKEPQTLAEYRKMQHREMEKDQTFNTSWPNWATAPGGSYWNPSYFGGGYYREEDVGPVH